MRRYSTLEINRYQSLKEDINIGKVDKAIQNIVNIINRRVGSSFHISTIVEELSNGSGNLSGVRCSSPDGRAIRFNWKMGGSSANVSSISYWKKPDSNPHLEIEVGQESLIKLIDIIVEVIQNGSEGEFLVEKVSPSFGGRVSKDISDSINTWKDENYESNSDFTRDLENTRISDLYNEYVFWYDNLSDEDTSLHKFVPKSTFMKYLGNTIKDLGIQNKFSRKIKVKKATKEILKVNKGSEKKFKDNLYSMSLEDKMEMIKMGVVAVVKGFSVARLYCGKAGIGKSTAVREQLDAFNADYKWYQGVIKNARALYQILYDNNVKDRIIVLDDIDSVLKNKEIIAILKASTDSKGDRVVSYSDNKITSGSKKYKDKMIFKGRIILISNLAKSKIDKAILSRTAPVEVNVDISEMNDFIRKNLEEVPPPIPIEWKMEVWSWMNDELGIKDIKDLDFRIFSDVLLWKASSPDNPIWKKFAYQILH